MFPTTFWILVIFLVTFIYTLSFSFLRLKQGRGVPRRPPGPPPLPVIGNLHVLGTLPHRTLQSLAKRYGPIMFLRLGQVPTIVVSSPEAAELFLKTHDAVFAGRPTIQATDYIFFGSRGMAFSDYGAYWRNMRRLCTSQFLSASKVESFAPLRKQELQLAVGALEKSAAEREVVDLSELVQNLLESIVYKMILGRTRDDQFDLKGLLHEASSLIGAFNVADYVPWLGAFDIQGITRRLKKLSKKLDEMMEKIMKEHEQDHTKAKDFIDILLSLKVLPKDSFDEESSDVIGRDNIKAIGLDMITGSFETTTVLILWALSELLRHPSAMENLQKELEKVVGKNQIVEEIDLSKLSYLDMVIKETLRLHPVSPFVIRGSTEDVTVDGYYIEKGSRILVNSWALGRDTNVWSENAEEFCPERFLNNKIDLLGHHFQLIPFGSGRRSCPGMPLGLTTAKLVVAQLMNCFNWKLPPGMAPHDLDMREKFGLSIPRVKHLFAVPTLRKSYLYKSW